MSTAADLAARSVSAVFEDGGLRFLSPPPFEEGATVVVTAAPPAETRRPAPPEGELEYPPLDPDDPLERLSHLVVDGPPDGSTHIDEYKLGLKKWPPQN